MRFPLVLGPYETKLVVVGPLPPGVSTPEPSFASGSTLAELNGDRTLDSSGQQTTAPLKSWEDLGIQASTVTYRKQFTAASLPSGRWVFLEIADVRDYVRVKLNSKELGAHAWQPYRWDITDAVKSGSNDVELEVRARSGGRGGAGAPPGGGRGGRDQRGATQGSASPHVYGSVGGIPNRGAGAPTVSGLLGPVQVVAR
ncbi:MAG TPA: hypothetical protein VKB88_21265 [Bryobacteraceae bacterium]|nr:hypothetical protein [Bryobacteraceae bacterium]